MVLPTVHSTPQPTLADTAPPALNGAKEVALRNFKPQSPALRGPHSPLLKDATPLRVRIDYIKKRLRKREIRLRLNGLIISLN